jgi:hypothetical protein
MALYAVFIVADSLFKMFLTDLGAGVFVTTITGIGAIVVVHMTTHAVRIMVPVEAKILVMLKGGRCPAFLGVAATAIALDLSMQRIPWIAVTTVALVLCLLLQQRMGELTDGTKRLNPLVLTVAGDAILLDQFLVEGHVFLLFCDSDSLGGY